MSLPTTAYPPGTMGVIASPELTPSGNHVAMASPTRRPNAAPTKTAITQMIDAYIHSQARPSLPVRFH